MCEKRMSPIGFKNNILMEEHIEAIRNHGSVLKDSNAKKNMLTITNATKSSVFLAFTSDRETPGSWKGFSKSEITADTIKKACKML